MRPVGRVEPDQVEPAGQLLADGVQGLVEQVRQGQHGRAGIEPVPGRREPADPAAGTGLAFQHGDVPARSGQPQRAGQAAQPGPDDDHVVGGSGDSTHDPPWPFRRLTFAPAYIVG